MTWHELRQEFELLLVKTEVARCSCFDKLVRSDTLKPEDWDSGKFDEICADCDGCKEING